MYTVSGIIVLSAVSLAGGVRVCVCACGCLGRRFGTESQCSLKTNITIVSSAALALCVQVCVWGFCTVV